MKTDELKEELENLAYENKRMGDFLERLGLSINDITDFIINGNDQDWLDAIELVKNEKGTK